MNIRANMGLLARCHHTLVHKTMFTIMLLFYFCIGFAKGNNLIGCFEKDDALQRINRVHEIKVQNCVEACIEEGKVYAAINTQICYCTNFKDDSHIVEGARCFPCSVNQEETCGGFGVVALYTTGVIGIDFFGKTRDILFTSWLLVDTCTLTSNFTRFFQSYTSNLLG